MPFAFPVEMLDGSSYTVTRLLGKGESNAKLSKSDKSGNNILTYGLSLAPANASGFNLCPMASTGCKIGCLYQSGQANIFPRTILPPRIAKSRLLRMHPEVFQTRLMTELGSAARRADKLGARLFVRLNVFSDIQWEKEIPALFSQFPQITYYDYTKLANRMMRFISGDFPVNYHLTFSRSENNWEDCLKVLAAGHNVAVPFHVKYSWKSKQPLPPMFEGFEVIDGDISDLRPLDPTGKIVGLRVKGPKAKADFSSGFIIDPATLLRGVA